MKGANKLMKNISLTGYLHAITSAILFGVSIPAAKYLLGEIDPWILAGILYLSSGIGLFFIFILRHFLSISHNYSQFKQSDWKWLIGSSLSGGVIAPILLLFGLEQLLASVTSLLLNLESVFTALLAWIVFNEIADRKTVIGVLLIIAGSFVLAWEAWTGDYNLFGTLLITLTCFFWAIDNNFLQKISYSDPVLIVLIRSFVAGFTNLTLGLLFGASFTINFTINLNALLASGIIGFVCYGLSMYFFILSLRQVGAAKAGAYYSLAPFIGAFFSIVFLNETVSMQFIIAGILMMLGVSLHMIQEFEKSNDPLV